jgi:hypothetical protein
MGPWIAGFTGSCSTWAQRSGVARRKEVEQLLGLPNPDSALVVQKQRFNGCSTGRRETGDVVVVPAEVGMPIVRARIEEGNRIAVEWDLDAIRFVQIATGADPGEIVEF